MEKVTEQGECKEKIKDIKWRNTIKKGEITGEDGTNLISEELNSIWSMFHYKYNILRLSDTAMIRNFEYQRNYEKMYFII